MHPEHPFLSLVHAADVELVNMNTKKALLLYRRQKCKSAQDFFANMQIDYYTFKQWWEGEPAQVQETTKRLHEILMEKSLQKRNKSLAVLLNQTCRYFK